MRINLDYYRILSIPIQADLAQLNRAYEDRLQQQPRREYSEYAIAARRKLLEQAYTILSDSEKRAEYDANFFASLQSGGSPAQNSWTESEHTALSQEPVRVSPYIEIEPELFIGALMILDELAEYEIVLRLGTDYLNDEEQASSNNLAHSSDSQIATKTRSTTEQKPDILLCLATSYLELSREQWRKEEFENAAISGHMGLNLLRQEKFLFPSLQAEIEAELNLLKPYRILELLGQNPPGSPLKLRGLQLLREMLLQYTEIEGTGKHPSGLKLDQFLCFIQQIRTYLTLQEQKKVFLAEARRGSHPASCVAAYALIAEGYTEKKPSSILQAQKILQNLSDRQNTHWERAICALLLGQTTQSQEIIKQIAETDILELIKKHSENSPDLLPGLCFYGEKWLQQKVLAQFQDLKTNNSTLAQYFGDRDVQAYLDRIAPVTYSNRQTVTTSQATSEQQVTASAKEKTGLRQLLPWLGHKKTAYQTNFAKTTSRDEIASSEVQLSATSPTLVGASVNHNSRHSSNLSNNSQGIKLPIIPKLSYPTASQTTKTSTPSSLHTKHQRKPLKTKGSAPKSQKIKRRRPTPKYASSKSYLKSGLLLIGLIGGLGTLGFVFTKNRLQNSSSEKIVVESVTPSKNLSKNLQSTPETSATEKTPQPTPKATVQASKNTATLTNASARKVIQKWLDSKAAALGQEHQINRLNSILTASLLTQWRNSSVYYKQNNIYRQFEHKLKISSVKINPENSDLAIVEAEVQEIAKHYQKGQLNPTQSYNDNLVVRYELIRQNDSWLIKNSEVLKSL